MSFSKVYKLVILALAFSISANTASAQEVLGAAQLRKLIVESLTRIETRVDEVESLKVTRAQVQNTGDIRSLDIGYSLVLRGQSVLSKEIHLNDPERKTLSVNVNYSSSCEKCTSKVSTSIDGQPYNDVIEDDRDGLAQFNEINAGLLEISE